MPNNKSISFPSFNKTGYIVGWGREEDDRDYAPILKNSNITIYNNSICDSTSSETLKNSTIQICGGDLTGKSDFCQGDEGGALYVLDKIGDKQKYVLAGIVSYGERCATPNKASLFTRTVAYLDWIKLNSIYRL